MRRFCGVMSVRGRPLAVEIIPGEAQQGAAACSEMPAATIANMLVCTDVLRCGIRTLRNLHQYRHARHKSVVRNRRNFTRNWMLNGNNNYELAEVKGHEREATENFGVYSLDSNNDKFIFSTANYKNLPAADRLSALVTLIQARTRVKDNRQGFDKAKLLLEALECYAEMRQLGSLPVFAEMHESEQDKFLQFAEGTVQYALRSSHSHTDSVAILIRAAEICDECRCADKRDEILATAEKCATRLGHALAFSREHEAIAMKPLQLEEVLIQNTNDIRDRNLSEAKEKYPHLNFSGEKEIKERGPAKRGGRVIPVNWWPLNKIDSGHLQIEKPR